MYCTVNYPGFEVLARLIHSHCDFHSRFLSLYSFANALKLDCAPLSFTPCTCNRDDRFHAANGTGAFLKLLYLGDMIFDIKTLIYCK